MCYFKGPGDRIEASRRPLGGATGDLWKPFGASSGSHGVLESSIEHKPVILVVRSRSKTLRRRKWKLSPYPKKSLEAWWYFIQALGNHGHFLKFRVLFFL